MDGLRKGCARFAFGIIEMKPEKDCISITPPPGFNAPNSLRPEINLRDTETRGTPDVQRINCGYAPIILSKLFGPLAFADLRIRAEASTCEWIIERENIKTMQWEEVIRIPGQKEEEFDNE